MANHEQVSPAQETKPALGFSSENIAGAALGALGSTPSGMTRTARVDALSFGATKNGVPAAEAIVQGQAA